MLKEYKGMDFDSPEMAKKAKVALHQKKCLYQNYKDTYKNMMWLSDKYLKPETSGVLCWNWGQAEAFLKKYVRMWLLLM